MSWPFAPRRSSSQKGAETRPGSELTRNPADARCFFFSSRRRHTRYWRDWSSDVCSSDLGCLYDIWGDASRGARASDRTLEALLEGGLLDEVAPLDGDDGVPVDGLELLPPVTRPG